MSPTKPGVRTRGATGKTTQRLGVNMDGNTCEEQLEMCRARLARVEEVRRKLEAALALADAELADAERSIRRSVEELNPRATTVVVPRQTVEARCDRLRNARVAIASARRLIR